MSADRPPIGVGEARVDAELDGLRCRLARSERRREVLENVILALGLDLGLEELLDRVVAAVAAATGSVAGFVYIWEEEAERLVLRAATEGDQRPFLGTIRLRLGEGVTGWSAETGQATVVNSNPLEDPRFSIYPELKEERFRAMLTAPILVRKDTVVGVFTLYSKRSGHFDSEHLRTAVEVASLLAAAIERAQLRDQEARQAKALVFLGEMMTVLSSSRRLREVLDNVIAMTLDVMAAELCLVVLFEPSEVRLTMSDSAFCAPGDRRGAAQEVIEQGMLGIAGSGVGRNWALAGALEELALCPPSHIRELATAPIVVGSDQIGLINCYRPGRYSPEEQQLLSTIADRVAMTVKVRRLEDAVLEHSPALRLHRLLITGTRNAQVSSLAAALGCDMSQPHMVLKARMLAMDGEESQDDLAERINRSVASLGRLISGFNPGSIVHCADGRVVALVRLCGKDAAQTLYRRLEEARSHVEDRLRVRTSAGLSSVVTGAGGYVDAYNEAKEALEIGSSLRGEGHVVAFDELGPYVYLHRISADPSVGRDLAMTKMRALVEYDRKRGSRLLETLDCYLECRGNASLAAQRLVVHRNTLRQRLARIEQLTEIDLADIDDWFPLQLASKLMSLKLSDGADGGASDLRGAGLGG